MGVDTINKLVPSLKGKVSDEEWETRVNLAACYHLVAHYGMSDLVFTHISARVPGSDHHFLINPYGLFFDEMTASSLIKVDIDGKILDDTPFNINPAGYTIHSAIHAAREDVGCVLHTHTTAGMAVSAQKQGLLPISQHSMMFYGRLAYHGYEGIALDLDERERLVRDMGDSIAMILRNHGLLTVGSTVPEAFRRIFYLEKSCESQIKALAGDSELIIPSREVCEHAASQFKISASQSGLEWPGLLRILDRKGANYRD
ncbi:class II aldolase/adducin family protein [Sneathiella chungangensis]|uniref:Class II aldolase/adducin family protein n=1 Tax=Sneathiella chungangensis TaxID=1418234 RepID=A0A845MEY1_9PROT|nr:class II aldolase/adducin family protein [Sneathiella chungangensis]MZR21866.1 class II aldolase/adducin family protein [Sneathiella chungangensis]